MQHCAQATAAYRGCSSLVAAKSTGADPPLRSLRHKEDRCVKISKTLCGRQTHFHSAHSSLFLPAIASSIPQSAPLVVDAQRVQICITFHPRIPSPGPTTAQLSSRIQIASCPISFYASATRPHTAFICCSSPLAPTSRSVEPRLDLTIFPLAGAVQIRSHRTQKTANASILQTVFGPQLGRFRARQDDARHTA